VEWGYGSAASRATGTLGTQVIRITGYKVFCRSYEDEHETACSCRSCCCTAVSVPTNVSDDGDSWHFGVSSRTNRQSITGLTR